jgi:hypothetical protein
MITTDLKMGRTSLIVALALVLGLVGFGTRSAVAQTISPNSIAVTSTEVDPEAAANDAAIETDLAADLDDSGDQASPARLPLPINVQGGWAGSITDNKLGAGDISITITQKNRKLSGGWQITWPTAPQPFTGNFKGRATARLVQFHLQSGQFNRKVCRLNFTSTSASGTGISGNYHWFNCGAQFRGGGTIDITPLP